MPGKAAYDKARLCLLAIAGQGRQHANATLKLLLTRGLPATRAIVAAWWCSAQHLLRRLAHVLREYVTAARSR